MTALRLFFREQWAKVLEKVERRAVTFLRGRGLYVLKSDKIDDTYNCLIAQRQYLMKSGHLLNGRAGRIPKARKRLIEGNGRALTSLIEAMNLEAR